MNMRLASRFVRRLSLIAGAAFLTHAVGTGAVLAAAAADQTSVAASDQLEDVIVTARKVEESAQSVPVALTALSSKDLEQQVVLDVQDLQTSVPGLFVLPNGQDGSPNFAVRGARQDNGTSPTVTVYIDDVPVHQTLSVANMVYDMQSITVLKGPQGTLFGANSTGGAIIFRPNKPTDTFEGYAQIGYGNYNREEFQGMVNIPVNQVLQFRVAGEIVRRDGFETNLTPGTPSDRKMDDDDHDSLRLSMRLRLSDTLLNDTVVDYYHKQDQPNEPVNVAYRSFDYPTFLGIAVPQSFSAYGIVPPGNFKVDTTHYPLWDKAGIYGIANTTNWDVNPNWSLKNVVGYRSEITDFSVDFGNSTFTTSTGRTRFQVQQWTWEPSSTVTWDDGRWNNKTGIYISNSAIQEGISFRVLGEPFVFTGLPAGTEALVDSFYPLQANEYKWDAFKSEAIYDQASVKLSDQLTFTAGARYTYDQAHHTETDRLAFPSQGLGPYGDFFYGPCASTTVSAYQDYNAADCTGTRSIKTNAPSFTLSLEDEFAERKMVYASLRGGYLVGGFNQDVAAPAGQVFAPERVTEFEGGLKADWDLAGRPFRTDVALFYGTYRGQQRVQYLLNPVTGSTYAAVSNAGSSLFYGADVALDYAPTSWLDLEASWEYLIAQYTNFTAALSIPGLNAAADLAGAQEADSPKDIFTAGATVKWPVTEGLGALSTTLSYYYRSASINQDGATVGGSCAGGPAVTTCTAAGTFIPNPALNFTAYDILPAFGIANLTTEWKGIAGSHVDAELWVKNLTNKLYYIRNANMLLTYGYAQFNEGDPRTYGVRLRYNF